MKLIYKGKAKEVYDYDNEHVLIKYTDNATAFNGEKHAIISQKGFLNSEITKFIFEYLNDKGIKTHFIKSHDKDSQICLKLSIIPLEVIVRNFTAGSLVTKLGMTKGEKLEPAIIEFSYKNDDLQDPLINHDHILALRLCSEDTLKEITNQARQINVILTNLFTEIDLMLVDFKLEFGLTNDGELVLADEFSPDNCRLWDVKTRESFDKDRFRNDLGEMSKYYHEVLLRLRGVKCE